MKLIEAKQAKEYADTYLPDPILRMAVNAVLDNCPGIDGDRVKELEEAVAHQRKRADTAEDFICTMCAECEWEVNDGILIMQKACCSWFPECEKFKLRVTDNNVGSKWIPVTERLPEEFVSVIVCIPCEHPLPMVKEAYLANGCWATKCAIFFDKDVTHWMPLPNPPKEVE